MMLESNKKTALFDLPLWVVVLLWLNRRISTRGKGQVAFPQQALNEQLRVMEQENSTHYYDDPKGIIEWLLDKFYWHIYSEYTTFKALNVAAVGWFTNDEHIGPETKKRLAAISGSKIDKIDDDLFGESTLSKIVLEDADEEEY